MTHERVGVPDLAREPDELLKRLERLVRALLSGRFRSANDIWRFEQRLLELQRDTQRAINEARPNWRADSGRRLARLRSIRWHARRLGDALAWVLLRADDKVLWSLSANQPVAIPPVDHGSRGMLVLSQFLANEGWGFPLLHDVTDVLRVGDVTFVHPERDPLTVEVKTRVVSETSTDSGTSLLDYRVTVLSASPTLEILMQAGMSADEEPAFPLEPLPDRARRQLGRLRLAAAQQAAEPGVLVEHEDGKPSMAIYAEVTAAGHTKVLQRVVRRARRSGVAYECTPDHSTLVVAVYDADGLNESSVVTRFDDVMGDAIASLLLDPPDDRNAIVLYSLVEERGRGPHRYLPYFLLNIPKASVIDMLNERLAVFIVMNPGRVIKALDEAGFAASLQPARNGAAPPSIVVESTVTTPDGTLRFKYGGLDHHIAAMIYEFRSLAYIVDLVKTLPDAVTTAVLQRAESA